MTEALLFEVEFALNRPQHIIGDPPLVAQLDHRRPFGGDGRSVEPLLSRCRIIVKRAAVVLARDASQLLLIVPAQIRHERVGRAIVGGLGIKAL
jgi:hypothetical protein